MRLHPGVVSAAGDAAQTPLDPEVIQTDWDDVVIPAGWTLTLGNPVYTATGMHCADTDGLTTDMAIHTVSVNRPITALSVVIAYTINVYGDGFIETSIASSEGFLARFNTETTTPDSNHYLPLNTPTFVSEALLATDTTGLVIVAMTLFQDGSRAAYRFDDNGITASPYAGATFEGMVTPLIQISTHNFDYNNEVEGTAGDFRLLHTYIGLDEELDQTAIEAIASGWGWAPDGPPTEPAALLGAVAWWDATDYTSGNLVNKGTGGAPLDMVLGAATAAPTFAAGGFTFDGVNDVMSCPDNDLLDFGSGAFTFGVVITPVTGIADVNGFMAKDTGAARWAILAASTSQDYYIAVDDGSGGPVVTSGLSGLTKRIVAGVLDGSGNMSLWINATQAATGAESEGSLSNAADLRIGQSVTYGFQKFVLHGAFVIASGALTVDDFTDICTYYGITP